MINFILILIAIILSPILIICASISAVLIICIMMVIVSAVIKGINELIDYIKDKANKSR